MAGLEVILQKIADDSVKQCTDIAAKAEREAEAIRAEAHGRAKTAAVDILAQAKAQADLIIQKAHSAAQTTHSRAVLAEKVAMIREVMTEAAEQLKALPNEQYAAALQKLAVRYARPGGGVMRVSAGDAARLPATFEADLNAQLTAQGASLRLETAAQESGGFVLIYGDIEQNCTIGALLEAMQEDLKDRINRALFV